MSIKDKIAVIGTGCSKFGENFSMGREDMLIDAVSEALADARIEPKDVQAAWIGIQYRATGMSGATLSDAVKLYGIPITHIENYCVSGLDAFRNACFAVASGEYDIALACGVEKLTDELLRGLPPARKEHPFIRRGTTAPGTFGLPCVRYFEKYGASKEDLARIAVKNHYNGLAHPKAQFRMEITIEQVLNAPIVSWPLGLLDCCPVSDGAAAVVVCRSDMAKSFRDDYVLLRGMGLAVCTELYMYDPSFDFLSWEPTVLAARTAYEEAGIKDPYREIDFAEVHDCFTITELLNYEDLGFCQKGEGAAFIREGRAAIDGELPVNPSGGLKCFGHPIGATGCRMIYEVTRQIQGRADGRQVKKHSVGLAHNLGGRGGVVCGVAILSEP